MCPHGGPPAHSDVNTTRNFAWIGEALVSPRAAVKTPDVGSMRKVSHLCVRQESLRVHSRVVSFPQVKIASRRAFFEIDVFFCVLSLVGCPTTVHRRASGTAWCNLSLEEDVFERSSGEQSPITNLKAAVEDKPAFSQPNKTRLS